MDKEYKVNILLTPHKHDNKEEPYAWSLCECTDKGWGVIANGWEETPEKAFEKATDSYNNLG